MWEGLLPIGSVVMLEKMTKPVMIMGVCQQTENDDSKFYDYSGIIYPEGYYDRKHILVFDREDITQVFYVGYMDELQHAYNEMMEPVQDGLKSGDLEIDEAKDMIREMLEDFRKEVE